MKQLTAGLALAFALVTVGCGGSPKQPAPAPAPAGPTCSDAAANFEKVFVAEAQKNGQDMRNIARATADAVAEQCASEAWGPDAVQCFAQGRIEDPCAEKLTTEQQHTLKIALKMALSRFVGDDDDDDDDDDDATADEDEASDDPCGE